MIRRQLALHGLTLLLFLAACAIRQQGAGPPTLPVAADASLQDVLDRAPAGARVLLAPARYVLTRPLAIRTRVELATQGAPDCAAGGCAVLALRMAGARPGERAITVTAGGTVLDHLVVEGDRADPARDDAQTCAGPRRPSMGGLGITAANVAIHDVTITGVSCYSATVADAGVRGLHFEHNRVIGNGTHDARAMWADGLTVTDGADDVIRGNLFRNDTDVALVLGGCRGCQVVDNRIEQTDAAAFAGLLVHAWPATSGDYTGTVVSGNTIDCGPDKLCGVGLGVGGRAWYISPTSGGVIAGNRIVGAAIGINVDDATGPVTMRDNTVADSGGPVRSRCGWWFAGPVNITAASRRFVDATAGVAMPAEDVTQRDVVGCLPGLA